MYRLVCIDKFIDKKRRQASIDKYVEKYWQVFMFKKQVQASKYVFVQRSIGENKKVKISIDWASIDQNRHVFNSIGKSRCKSIAQIVDKSMKRCLRRHFCREERKEKERKKL